MWLLFSILLALLVIGAAAIVIACALPDDEGERPDLDLVVNRERAREEALRRIAERQQRQREASSHLTRGF